jgi:hypothetical protein
VPARDHPQVLELGAGVGVAFNVASEMEQDAAPIANREEGNFDVAHVVFLGGVVSLVAEAVDLVVNGLVAAVGSQLLFRQVALDGISGVVSKTTTVVIQGAHTWTPV